jgi:hypothetical protein
MSSLLPSLIVSDMVCLFSVCRAKVFYHYAYGKLMLCVVLVLPGAYNDSLLCTMN